MREGRSGKGDPMPATIVTIALLLLSVAGLANAVYFTLVYYRVIRPDSRRIPSVCRMSDQTCRSVVFTRYGRVLSVPNSLLGIPFYLLVLDVALARLFTGTQGPLNEALIGAAAAIVLGIYLIHALLIRLKTPCPL
jgi:uncharacterized membrane protein